MKNLSIAVLALIGSSEGVRIGKSGGHQVSADDFANVGEEAEDIPNSEGDSGDKYQQIAQVDKSMAKNGMGNSIQQLAQAAPSDHAYTSNSKKQPHRDYFAKGLVASKTLNHIMESADNEFEQKKAAPKISSQQLSQAKNKNKEDELTNDGETAPTEAGIKTLDQADMKKPVPKAAEATADLSKNNKKSQMAQTNTKTSDQAGIQKPKVMENMTQMLEALDYAEKETEAKKLWKKDHQNLFKTLDDTTKYTDNKASEGEGHQLHAKKNKVQSLAQHKGKAGDDIDEDMDIAQAKEQVKQQNDKLFAQKKSAEKKVISNAKKAFKEEFNEFDGLIHKDGVKINPNDGIVVQENLALKNHDKHHPHQPPVSFHQKSKSSRTKLSAEAVEKSQAESTVDIDQFEKQIDEDDHANDMDVGQSLSQASHKAKAHTKAQSQNKSKSQQKHKKGSHVKHTADNKSKQKKQMLSQSKAKKEDFDYDFEEEDQKQQLHEAAERAQKLHQAQLKKDKEDIEKSIMPDGLIHKDGKRFEPFTNKEIEDGGLIKMHTKKHQKKQEPQAMSQSAQKSQAPDGFDVAFEEEMKFAADTKAKEAKKAQNIAQVQKAKEDLEKAIGPDGLVHKDGKRIDPSTGTEIDENQLLKTKHKHQKKQPEQSMAQKKNGSKDAFDTGVEDQNQLNREKKHKARTAKHNEEEMKSAILETTLDTSFVKTKKSHASHSQSKASAEKKVEKHEKKTQESKKVGETKALAQAEKHHKHHKKAAVKHEKKAEHKAQAKTEHKEKKEHHHKHKHAKKDKVAKTEEKPQKLAEAKAKEHEAHKQEKKQEAKKEHKEAKKAEAKSESTKEAKHEHDKKNSHKKHHKKHHKKAKTYSKGDEKMEE